ncbi:Uncharacterized protein APZ42_005565 [Daphnia magna]|uniref:HTH CENPB-type domain-containing protein n=1 Tax=Daphnia magna TaxID=35525 RepID=A0A162D4W7_9CRUS|nr:Uncharacterized protein APZ42_005565 [Daphnia magna]
MKDAISQLQGKSLRKVSEETGISKTTLNNYRKISKASRDIPPKPLCHGNQILSTDQESELAEYLVETQKEGCALTPKLLKELTFSYARYNGIVIPSNWSKNSCAGADWFTNFMKRHPRLTLRKPEGASIARTGVLNHPVMENFYYQVEVLYKKYDFTDGEIFNIDETNDPTVLDSEKVIAETGTHQVIDLIYFSLFVI